MLQGLFSEHIPYELIEQTNNIDQLARSLGLSVMTKPTQANNDGTY
jgi:hypothetical protein